MVQLFIFLYFILDHELKVKATHFRNDTLPSAKMYDENKVLKINKNKLLQNYGNGE